MRDWGVSIFQVSEHAGARPLCYPYQGRYYSTDGSGGVARDLHGKEIRYEPIGMTSYGQAGGLFGINCGHYRIPFIPGFSVARRRDPEPKAENDEQYRAMQRQRRLEREVRAAKREAACLNAVGDKEGFQAAAMLVKSRQARLNAFIRENGLTRRDDRTQVFGYNQSVSGKAAAALRTAKTPDGKQTTMTVHVMERMRQRGVTMEAVNNALLHPLKISSAKVDERGLSSVKYVGAAATVSVNPDTGHIVTTYPTSRKIAAKLKGASP